MEQAFDKITALINMLLDKATENDGYLALEDLSLLHEYSILYLLLAGQMPLERFISLSDVQSLKASRKN